MKKFFWMVLLAAFTKQSHAQNRFTYNGRLFITHNIGYKTPVSSLYKGQPTDEMISLEEKGFPLGLTIQYYPTKNWGMYSDIQYNSNYNIKKDDKGGVKIAEQKYEADYFFKPFDVSNSASYSISWRLLVGPSYSMEKNNFTLRTGIGAGITEFRTSFITGLMKEKNSNSYHDMSFTPEGIKANRARPLTLQANVQTGYRWHKYWASTITLAYTGFNSGFDYVLRNTNLYTGQSNVDRLYSYKGWKSDITFSLGMSIVVGKKKERK